MLSFFSEYYYISFILQGLCVLHCIKKGNENKWIWIIVILPVVGCIAYIFTEIFTRREMDQVQSGVSSVFNPTGKIKRLQSELNFRDTFDNRIALADAYLEAGNADRAIEIYEQSLTGTFAGHEHGNLQLIKAYYEKRRYEDMIPLAKNVYNLPQFKRSRAQTLYAVALGATHRTEEAKKEFESMNGRFSNYESRFFYGKFLASIGETEAAKKLFKEIAGEASHLSNIERRQNNAWFSKVKDELKNFDATASK